MRLLRWVASVVGNLRGVVLRPSWCTYLVTYRCNARCTMCDAWQLAPGTELTPDEVAEVFGQLGRLDVVRISGGEPFLRKDLGAVAEAIWRASRPAVIHITTNGAFGPRAAEFVRRFSQPRRLRFMVSFDGLADEHDANRGAEASFERALDTVRRLAELRRTHGIEVSANHTVISPRSLADGGALRAVLAKAGVEVHAVLAYASSALYGAGLQGQAAGRLLAATGYPLHPRLAGEDVVGFVERELRAVATYRDRLLRWGKRYYLRGLRSRMRGETPPSPRPRCVALRSHVRVLPDGRVPVCQFNSECVGDLRRQDFAAVWQGVECRTARAWVARCPGCWAECEALPSAIYTGDIVRGVLP
jgi:Fe-coproporphyrin III synthase